MRLIILIVLAVLPLGGLIVYGLIANYETTLRLASDDLMRTASMAAKDPEGLFENARSMLLAAKAEDTVGLSDREACQASLQMLLAGNPQFLAMGVLDESGSISCHSSGLRPSLNTDPSVVGLALRTLASQATGMVVGDFMIDRRTGQPTVAVAIRLAPDRRGVVFVSLNFERLTKVAEGGASAAGLSMTLVHPGAGRMMTHDPPIPREVETLLPFGTTLVGSRLVAAMAAQPTGGIVEAEGPDGIERVYAFVPLRGAETGMMLAIGQPRAVIMGPQTRTAWMMGIIGVAVLTLVLGAVWWIGLISQVRPIERLTRFAQRLEGRENEARIEMEAWQPPELRTLGRTLNAAAVRLDAARRAEEAVAASESRFRLLAENTADLIAILDADGVPTFVSPASKCIVGRDPQELIGRPIRETAHPDDGAAVDGMLDTLRSGGAVADVRYRMAHQAGHFVWVEVSGRSYDDGARMTLSARDITRRRGVEMELEQANRVLAELATTDGLTGLANRRSFDASLDREIARCRRDGVDLTLLFIDIDRFKLFNDSYGHLAGDECLRRVSKAVRDAMRRPADIAARYGGEEIAVILPGTNAAGASNRANRIVEAVRELAVPHLLSEHGIVTVSVGTAVLRPSGSLQHAASDLIGEADVALYAAKKAGRDRVVEGRQLAGARDLA
ncbi:hypothetical protein ASG43_01950 [Aureimonas sp. Leaf454]|uniref:diguanylate cyclase n=1 Tax=Aureimonas sp. Leaf454 TaxID=1736381 RepID=UPI0006FF3532|nr:diguanylate cyclase [Aureimonas sp. Leaf454]KQT54394.1 hypothetical protein ASG43_01950 [Aureimonas sp. Leaf454]